MVVTTTWYSPTMNRMGPWEQVVDFFRRLVKGRIDGVEIGARSKMRNVEYRAKSAVAGKFNKAVDGTVNKAKGAVKPSADAKAEDKPAANEAGTETSGAAETTEKE